MNLTATPTPTLTSNAPKVCSLKNRFLKAAKLATMKSTTTSQWIWCLGSALADTTTARSSEWHMGWTTMGTRASSMRWCSVWPTQSRSSNSVSSENTPKCAKYAKKTNFASNASKMSSSKCWTKLKEQTRCQLLDLCPPFGADIELGSNETHMNFWRSIWNKFWIAVTMRGLAGHTWSKLRLIRPFLRFLAGNSVRK